MISIAMTTFNGEKYIKEQLYSILNQTIHDFELVICDDASSDNTTKIIQETANHDKRIRLYVNPQNIGFKKNFEKAINLCKGEYIALSDQDDIWKPNHLELLFNIIGNKMVACGNSLFIDEKNNILDMTLSHQEALDYFPDDDIERAYSLIFFRNPFQGASMLIKKEFFKKALPIPEKFKFHDSWFAILSCFYGGLNYTQEVITHYRQHSNNVTGNRKCQRKSRLKHMIVSIIYQNFFQERIYALQSIKNRVNTLTNRQLHFLNKAEDFFSRKKTIKGKIANLFFSIYHFKKIYSCK